MSPNAEEDAGVEEPRQRFVRDGDGRCWRAGCFQPFTHTLLTRGEPNRHARHGLLIEAAYCWEDAVWFAGATVALNGGTFLSLTERPIPPGEGDSDADS